MTLGLGMLNIPPLHPQHLGTSSTSLVGDLRQRGLEDVEDVEPKKNIRDTYLLSVAIRGSLFLRPVRATHTPICSRAYLPLNILNIPKTWRAPSPRVQMARALDDLAARQRAALARLARQTPAIRPREPR